MFIPLKFVSQEILLAKTKLKLQLKLSRENLKEANQSATISIFFFAIHPTAAKI
jgi:hypothetical protein